MELSEIREHIDRLDRAMVLILAERMSLIPKVAEYKKKHNIQRYQPEREKAVLGEKTKMAKELGLNPELIADLFKRIIEDAHRMEKEIMGN